MTRAEEQALRQILLALFRRRIGGIDGPDPVQPRMMPLHQQPCGGTAAGLLIIESVQQLDQPRSQRFLLLPLCLSHLKLGQCTVGAIDISRVAAPVGLLLELTDLLPLLQEALLQRSIHHRDPGRGRAMIKMAFARLDGWKAQEIEHDNRLNDAGVDGRPPGIVN